MLPKQPIKIEILVGRFLAKIRNLIENAHRRRVFDWQNSTYDSFYCGYNWQSISFRIDCKVPDALRCLTHIIIAVNTESNHPIAPVGEVRIHNLRSGSTYTFKDNICNPRIDKWIITKINGLVKMATIAEEISRAK